MTRTEYVLAVLSAAQASSLTPVQLQKLFFILDKRGADVLGGPHFDFQPYNYGPFDPAVYREVESLSRQGLAEVGGDSQFTMKTYRATPAGAQLGAEHLATLGKYKKFVTDVVEFVQARSFADLVAAVYAEWPEMRAKSIFRG